MRNVPGEEFCYTELRGAVRLSPVPGEHGLVALGQAADEAVGVGRPGGGDALRIVVIEGGRIMEKGSHAQLMEEQGRYYQLYTGQFELD